ncbi:phosphoglycerate mutase-like protein [Auriscalpium vulgare]|uniref:Phosphoglycerate mutase-like protein n=1 Tax=Auriscalpium vulgare TaxID=40419 RepID=A0ACB8RZ50_9AGAM|nr:phosphoglycerate mutase-like protein [Auriscalpium vulgare]
MRLCPLRRPLGSSEAHVLRSPVFDVQPSAMSSSTVLGVFVLVRHGDRQGFYQDPTTYAASHTSITPLGNAQEFALGDALRQLYLNESSPSHVQNMNAGLFNDSQVWMRADAGDEGGVIFDSAVSLSQGLWPATSAYNTTLANGTTITGPLAGYQTIPIESVESTNDVSLEGFTSCTTFNTDVSAFYNSSEFNAKKQEAQSFLSQLPPYLDGRPATLQNMWNVFDYMNVNSIHNADFARALPSTFLAQARDLANWHEYNTFSSEQLDGIGNIAGRTVVPSMLTGLSRIANASDPLSFMVEAISYKPFISLFNMTGAVQANSGLAGVVNYASAWALEVRQPSGGGPPVLRFNFKNGTDDEFRTYSFLGYGSDSDVPLSTFMNTLAPAAVNTTAQWCGVCGNSQDRGCGLLAQASAAAKPDQPISPVGAGFLGAGLALVVALLVLGVLTLLGMLTFGKGKRARKIQGEKSKGMDSESV